MPSAVVLLADGAEEMEAVIAIDVMRRGGIAVTVAGVEGAGVVTCSRGVVIRPDSSLDEALAQDYDAVILPGGMPGAKTLAESAKVGELLKKQESRNAIVAAICAAPIALASHGVGAGKKLTSHPSVRDQLTAFQYEDTERVVVDGSLITSRAPGTAFEFALALVAALQGTEKKDEIIPPMLLKL